VNLYRIIKQQTMNDTIPTFDEFRRRIPIMELALSHGYVLNRSKGVKWPVLQHPDGDRVIIVNPGSSANQGYFNPGDDRDRGTLVHFVMNRLGTVFPMDASLTRAQNVNRILCDWLRVPYAQRLALRKEALPSSHGSKVTELHFSPTTLEPLSDTGYLLSRGILPATITDLSFQGRILSCRGRRDGTVAFPYRETIDGPVIGAEARGPSMKRHLPGTRKSSSVWVSHPPLVTRRIIVCESAIDCLSYHQLKGAEGDLYISFGGSLTCGQLDCILKMHRCLGHWEGAKVIIAVDNDEAGEVYSVKLKRAFPDAELVRPSVGKDFNETLKQVDIKRQY
jgi:hypothetical protein